MRAAAIVRQAAIAAAASLALCVTGTAAAQSDEDLPGRVGRVADVAGELFIAPQDKPEAWMPAGINYPVASGDNLWLGGDGRAEIDFGGGQFRFAADTSVHVSQLDDRSIALFVAQGRVSLRVRALDPGDVATIDTPNAQIAITRPGLYRFEVTDDRQHTVVIVREGEANVQTQAALQQVLPGQAAYIDGADPQHANVQNGIGLDGFDSWVASRDRLYRTRGNNYVSPQMVGAADLDRYGTWQQMPEYGAVWYPNDVASDWAPYRNGYWVDVGTWGPTWVDFAPWGYAPFHYGRWAFVGGRWGWCPGVYAPRPLWAPALVAWTGGAGWSLSVSTGGPVYGWVPLGWGEPFRPWWGRCSTGCWDRFNRPFAVNVAVVRPWSPPPQHWRNASAPGGITAVPFQSFQARQPVPQNIVRVPRDVVASAPSLASPPIVRNDPGRALVQRPASAPPPASTFQPAMARQMPAAPGGASVQRGLTGGEGNVNRSRAAMPAAVGSVPGAPGASPGAGNVARPAPAGAPFAQSPVPGRAATADGAGGRTPSPVQRDARPGMAAPPSQGAQPPSAGQSTTAVQPAMRAQPQQAQQAPQGPAMRAQPQQAPQVTPSPAMRASPQQAPQQALQQAPQQVHVPQSASQPAMRAAPPQASMPQPAMRSQPQPMQVPQAQPAMRQPAAPPQAAPQPAMRAQPQQAAPPLQPAMRAQPQQAAPPLQPAMRAQPQQAAPQPAPHPAPASRAAPQPSPAPQPGAAPESARQGAGEGNVTRGERGRDGAR